MENENSKGCRKRPDLSLTKLRSAITNGSALLSDLDHRGAWARRLRDLIGLHLSDLGGEDAVSESEKVLVRRAAMLTLQLELMEQRFSQNEGGEARAQEIESYQRDGAKFESGTLFPFATWSCELVRRYAARANPRKGTP